MRPPFDQSARCSQGPAWDRFARGLAVEPTGDASVDLAAAEFVCDAIAVALLRGAVGCVDPIVASHARWRLARHHLELNDLAEAAALLTAPGAQDPEVAVLTDAVRLELAVACNNGALAEQLAGRLVDVPAGWPRALASTARAVWLESRGAHPECLELRRAAFAEASATAFLPLIWSCAAAYSMALVRRDRAREAIEVLGLSPPSAPARSAWAAHVAEVEALAATGAFRGARDVLLAWPGPAPSVSLEQRRLGLERRIARVLGHDGADPDVWSPAHAARMRAHAEATGAWDQAAAAAGRCAAVAAAAGDTPAALGHLSAADQYGALAGNGASQRRTARQRVEIELGHQTRDLVAIARDVRSLLHAAVAAGDQYDECRLLLLLGECVPAVSIGDALAALRAARALADRCGYRSLIDRSDALLAILDTAAPPAAIDDAVLSAVTALALANDHASRSAALTALTGIVTSLPATRRGHAERWVAIAARRAGVLRVAEGVLPCLLMDDRVGELWRDGERVFRSNPKSQPWRLLSAVLRHGDSVDREALFEAVWEQPYRPPSSDNALHVAVHRLRGRLGDVGIQIEATREGRFAAVGCGAIWAVGRAAEPVLAPPRLESSPVSGRLVGREAERAQLESMVLRHRLITVVGPGGIGKTRLTWEFSRAAGGARRWWIELTHADGPEDVVHAVARSLGMFLRETGLDDQIRSVGWVLAGLPDAILILDHFEHLVGVAEHVLERWLHSAAGLRLVVTSRRRLVVSHEALELGPLAPLNAVELFQERARVVSGEYLASPADLDSLRELVQRLDGHPLAIELAAARMGELTPGEILDRLSQRFQLLRGSANGGEVTLFQAIAWSWALLSPSEQHALAIASVFVGGFHADAAEAVLDCEEYVPDLLRRLKDLGLLRAGSGQTRLTMPESVRDFAAERLPSVRRDAAFLRHAEYFLATGRRHSDALAGPDQRAALEWLVAERENLLAVADRFEPRDPELAARACFLAAREPSSRGPFSRWCALSDRAVRCTAGRRDAIRFEALVQAASAAVATGRANQALIDEIHELATEIGDPCQMALVRFTRGRATRDIDQAIVEFERAEELVPPRETRMLARILASKGYALHRLGRAGQACAALEHAVSLFEDIGDEVGLAGALGNLGAARRASRHRAAEPSLVKAVDLARSHGNSWLLANVLNTFGNLLSEQGRVREARAAFEETIAIADRLGDVSTAATARGNLGETLAMDGQTEQARAHLLRARTALRANNRWAWAMYTIVVATTWLEDHEPTLAVSFLDEAAPVVEELVLPDLTFAFRVSRGDVARDAGRFSEAIAEYEQALRAVSRLGDRLRIAMATARCEGCRLAMGAVPTEALTSIARDLVEAGARRGAVDVLVLAAIAALPNGASAEALLAHAEDLAAKLDMELESLLDVRAVARGQDLPLNPARGLSHQFVRQLLLRKRVDGTAQIEQTGR